MLTLIPKGPDATSLKKFRPIALTNCIKKIQKACIIKMGACADRLISINQTAFIKGRYILDNVVTAHEIIHAIYHKEIKEFC